jgi:hypothetical protein
MIPAEQKIEVPVKIDLKPIEYIGMMFRVEMNNLNKILLVTLV